jgi:hypothetical protein
MNLVGANRAATVVGQDELEGKVNYFLGNDPAKWQTDVPTFGRVRYAEVYPDPGFVFIEYFGFMRRDPDDAPDTDLTGFNFWLQKMNDHTLPGEDARLEPDAFGRIKRAEMIKSFIVAGEFRGRFGP